MTSVFCVISLIKNVIGRRGATPAMAPHPTGSEKMNFLVVGRLSLENEELYVSVGFLLFDFGLY